MENRDWHAAMATPAASILPPSAWATGVVAVGMRAHARPDGVYLEIAIDNIGRGLTKAQGSIDVGDDFRRDFDVDTFVPRTSIGYPVKWTAEAEEGEYPARVDLRYGERTAQWEGTFSVGSKVLKELADRAVTPADASGEDDGSGIPAPALVGAAIGGAVLVGGGGLAVSRMRRPRARHARRRG